MTSPETDALAEAMLDFDGAHTDALERFAAESAVTPELIQRLCDFASSDDRKAQSAATWLIKRMTGSGATLSARQTETLLDLFSSEIHWQARLHLLQMLDRLVIPAERAPSLWDVLMRLTEAENKFVRAWSYFGLAVLARQHPDFRAEALALLAAGEGDTAASVRARIRRIRKAFKWS